MGPETWIGYDAAAGGERRPAEIDGGSRKLADPDTTHVMLRNGDRARLRPVHTDDEDLLRDEFVRCSQCTRRRQRFGNVPISVARLSTLVHADAAHHEAWIAIDAETPGDEGIGVGRYVRLEHEPWVAEAVIQIVDSHQHLGLGPCLLAALARAAGRNGIDVFRAYVRRVSCETIRQLRDLGATVQYVEGEVLCFDVPVPTGAEPIEETPLGRTFHVFSEWMFEPAVTGPDH